MQERSITRSCISLLIFSESSFIIAQLMSKCSLNGTDFWTETYCVFYNLSSLGPGQPSRLIWWHKHIAIATRQNGELASISLIPSRANRTSVDDTLRSYSPGTHIFGTAEWLFGFQTFFSRPHCQNWSTSTHEIWHLQELPKSKQPHDVVHTLEDLNL